MLKRKNLYLLLISILIILLFNVFKLTPLSKISTYLSFAISSFGHILFYRKKHLFPKKIKYWYYLGLTTMFISMIVGYLIYQQSFISGIVANINFYNIGSVIVFFYFFLKKEISFIRLFSIMKYISWFLVVFIALMVIMDFKFINQSELTGNIVIVNAGKLSKDLTNFFGVYWLSLFLIKNNYKYLLFSLLFFGANHFYEIQRFVLLVDILLIFISILIIRKSNRAIKVIVPALFSLGFIYIFLSSSSTGQAIIDRFVEATKLFTEDSNSITDTSSAARVYEIDLAINKFRESPLFGNGFYRASDANKVIGEEAYFHVSDIGIFGVLFSLGIFGVILFLQQYRLIWKELKIKSKNHYQLCLTLSLVFLMLYSLLTARSINNYTYFFFLFSFYQMSLICNTPNIIKQDDKEK